jgi:tetratricopeptide (TPR) repeat protein
MPSIEQLQRLYEADPTDPFAPYALAQELAKQGEHERAIEHYDLCLALDADYLYAYFHKARSLEAAGRVQDAIDVLRAGAARAANDAKAQSEIAGYLDQLSA